MVVIFFSASDNSKKLKYIYIPSCDAKQKHHPVTTTVSPSLHRLTHVHISEQPNIRMNDAVLEPIFLNRRAKVGNQHGGKRPGAGRKTHFLDFEGFQLPRKQMDQIRYCIKTGKVFNLGIEFPSSPSGLAAFKEGRSKLPVWFVDYSLHLTCLQGKYL